MRQGCMESDSMEGKFDGSYREICTDDFKEGDSFGYILDVSPQSFTQPEIKEIILSAKTIFVNAVMGFTPNFYEGSKAPMKP